ncbi:hypothetical protein IWW47_002189 [Coemansia sp. RSA 2052]|nr:hypothetical protein IWW47_002189 [Coemansia sp. RSA 2052]
MSAPSLEETYASGSSSRTSVSVLPACQPATFSCDDGQILVLSVSESSCSWSCESDPHYHKPADNKRPVIGGSLGAMVLDTADLASELSNAPLMQPSSPGSPSGIEGLDASMGGYGHSRVFAWGAPRERKSHSAFFATPAMPSPGEAGTELSMDIVNRPPESDPSLAATNGSTPYRQEKTADAYPLLSYFSGRLDPAPATFQHATLNQAPANIGRIPFPPTSQAKPARLQRAPTQPDFDLEPPESHLMRSYAAARSSGDAAIAAARESAITTLPATAFDPFNAVPSIRSSPYSEEAQSLVSRRASDRTGRSLTD